MRTSSAYYIEGFPRHPALPPSIKAKDITSTFRMIRLSFPEINLGEFSGYDILDGVGMRAISVITAGKAEESLADLPNVTSTRAGI